MMGCINPRELLLLLLTEVYPERQLVLTSFVSPEHKSFKIPLSKKKEKVDVTRGKGIELLSQVALIEDAQFKEVQKKSVRDFHKTHPSRSGIVTKTAPSAAKIKTSVTSEGTGVKLGVLDVTKEESSESEAESWGNDEDDRNNEQESSGEDSDQKNDSDDNKTQSDNENESNSEHETDENESGSESDQDENEEDEDDEEEVKDELLKTSQLYDDVDIWLNEPVDTDKVFVQEEGTDAAMTNVQQGNEILKILQVIEDAHVTLSTVPQKTEVLVTNSSHSSDLAAKFLNFSDIPHNDVEIVSLMDVHVHHEVLSQQTPTLLTVPVLVISDSSQLFSTVIPQSLPSFTSPPQQSTSIPPPTTKATNSLSALPNFASVFQFNNRVTTLEKEVVELKKDPLHTQSLEDPVLAKESSQPQSSYEAAATLTEFELKKILIDKMDKSKSYLAALEHRECYEGLKKSYDLDKTIFSTYGKMYLLKRSRKDKDEDPSVGLDRGLKKRKTGKDVAPPTGPKAKESQSGSSKSNKSLSKSFRKSVQSEEPEFEVVDSDMPQDQEENLGKDDEEPKENVAYKRDWFTKPTQTQEPTDPVWNVDKSPQQGQNQSWLMTLASSAEKPSKTFDEFMSTPIDFSTFIINGMKINNLTQETLLGPTFRLLKGTHSNYAELEYDFEECYKALSEKLVWENPEGGDYPFDLTKPLPLVMSRN
ncbi:hypothetical protein Tco_1147535, partial [Tanacetum coccineum]